MDRQEEARAASEQERLRRLMLEGVIEAPDDYRAVVHGEHHRDKPKKKKRRKNKRIVSRLTSNYVMTNKLMVECAFMDKSSDF